MHPDHTPTPMGELVAELFLKRLAAQGFRSCNRHVVDYLPSDVGEALFDALLQLTNEPVPVCLPKEEGGRREVPMLAIRLGDLDILPFLVTAETSHRQPTPNQGTEGYASCLRDHYADDAPCPRLLVVITTNAIETQKSAQDSLADRALITLEQLLHEVLERHQVPPEAPQRTVADVYRAHQDGRERWSRVVETFERYVEQVADEPPEAQGAKLPMLGCFLPDARPDFAEGESVRILEDKDQRRRERGQGRLFDNALLHEFLNEAFQDPIVDPEHVLAEVFEDDPAKAKEIAQGGPEGLQELDLGTFAGMEQRRQKRKKNNLERTTLEVKGAAYHRLFGQGDESLLVVASARPFTISFDLGRPYTGRKERAQLGQWNASKEKLDLSALPVNEGATRVTFPLDPRSHGRFSVWRVALTKGPRSLRSTIDSMLVVVYHSNSAEVVVEEGRLVSLEDQAWIAEGEPSFHRYHEGETEPLEVLELTSTTPEDDSGETVGRRVQDVHLAGTSLTPRVVEERPEPADDDDTDGDRGEPTLELACSTHRRGHATTTAMRAFTHYLDAVVEIHEGASRYKVDLEGGNSREVWAHQDGQSDPFRNAQAVAQLLLAPDSTRVQWSASARTWTHVPTPDDAPPSVVRYLDTRRSMLEALRELAEPRLPRFRRVPAEAAVPVNLLPLHRIRSHIEAVLHAWNEAADDTTEDVRQFSGWHDLLLQSDTLRVTGEGGDITRLVVLPTHPWLIGSLLAFQDRFAENVLKAKERRGVNNTFVFDLTRSDVQQMLPRAAVEDWYVWHAGVSRLLLTDSAPFHLEFVPAASHVHRDPLDYVSRVVANKIGRYLRMHPHLRDHRRTLRIGFVNPGSGKHLLQGLEQWLRLTMREHAGRIRDLPLDAIPAVDVFLFADDRSEAVGADFERFFREQVSAGDDDVIRQALLARIQYRFCTGSGPSSPRDAVHICFLHGLVDPRDQRGKTGQLDEWWDGGFGDGLLSTYLRRTLDGGPGHALRSRRGLWIDPSATGMRGALARMMALQRGCRDGDLAMSKAVYWETSLPNLRQMADTYEQSDWVVHLDRELSLEVFRRGPLADLPTIIEYSDQEVPESPGYDTITATRHATPYREQLGEILTTVDLDVSGRSEEAHRAANDILDDINVLSGSWALDFLLGSIADQRTSMRLKGNVGSALVYRWLRRMELGHSGSPLVDSNVGEVVPVFISLEDLLRATPAAGLSRKDGLVYRYTNEVADEGNKEAARWCDDLLVLYLTKTEDGAPSRIYGRVIEVKFGKSAKAAKGKAVGQVRNTQQLLQERLSGDDKPLDAPFRHKQLSLLIKAQLEQAVAMGLYSNEVYEFLNVPALSSNLATGRYSVDYTLGEDGQHLNGDAFLLHTEPGDDQHVSMEIVDGVRVITIPRTLVEWLAFELADSPTLTARPKGTFPRLGRYGSVQTRPGATRRTLGGDSVPGGAPEEPPPGSDAEVEPPPQEEPLADDAIDLPSDAPEGDDVVIEEIPEETESEGLSLAEACQLAIKEAPYPDGEVVDAVARLEKALVGHKVKLTSSPSPRETDRGPRLLRAYVRLEPGESINAVRRISEDVARVVGTATSDIHISNVPERHAVGLDLPLPGLTYAVTFDELMEHPSFDAAQRELTLGFCAGIDVTGRPVWTDLAGMPHMLVAGTTGSGKTVFLRNVILTLLLNNSPEGLVLRLSSSKPMDFRVFTKAPHAQGRDMARDAHEAKLLADELVEEMERRYHLLDEAMCDNLAEYNDEHGASPEPYIVAVFDEYAEMISSFSEKADRDAFESAISRLAQKARAAGLHLVVCMQRPDANALKGGIKANILHRFALKLPQNHDSRVILDENGAETLLGQGDLLYKDANSRLMRLQVPFLENATLKRNLQRIIGGGGGAGVDPAMVKSCPKCGASGTVGELFGVRRMRNRRKDGTEVVVERAQSYCKSCRNGG